MESLAQCTLCENSASDHQVNGNAVCQPCYTEVLLELENEQSSGINIIPAVIGGTIGSLLGGIIWAAIAVGVNAEIGYVAVGVGWLAGFGVSLGSGRKTGQPLQFCALITALLGLLIGKYGFFAHSAITGAGEDLSYLDPEIIRIFVNYIGEMVNFFDILWVFFALSTAWRMLAPSEIETS